MAKKASTSRKSTSAPKAAKAGKVSAKAKSAKPTSKVASKAASKPDSKAASKASAKPTPKSAAKPNSKASSKPAAKSDAKATSKPEAKAQASKKADSKPVKPVEVPAKPEKAQKPEKAAKTSKAAAQAEAAKSKPAATLAQVPAVAPPSANKAATPPKPAANQPPRPIKRPKAPTAVYTMPAGMGRLMDPKNPVRKPLIPSGPKAANLRPLGMHTTEVTEQTKIEGRSPFNKRELDRFRNLLLRKRAELVGDVNTMENEALRGQSGSMSNSPSHMAEQGSEAYDQALSLDLAAADRKLIKEIDDAIDRIKDGVYGLCEITGKPIKLDRLEELPWARYSIEAARELERQSMRG